MDDEVKPTVEVKPKVKVKVKKTGYHRLFDYPRTAKKGWRRWMFSFRQISSFVLGGFLLLAGLIAFEYYTVQIPPEPVLAQASVFDYSDGSTQFAGAGQTTRVDVTLNQVPPMMQDAIISAENRTFWTDPGVSYTGIVRSFLNDAEGKPLQGGSTLTQQYVKNAFLTDDPTFSRKIDEIFISLKIAKTESKSWVLQHYLNTVFFGRNADGIQASAKAWLGKDISQVTDPADAALLASLVNEPTYFSSGYQGSDDPAAQQALKQRWQYVLGQMADNGYITKAQAADAVFPTPIPFSVAGHASVQGLQMADAVDSWLDQWSKTHPDSPTADEVNQGGYTVVTTFDQQAMTLAQNAVQDQFLDKLSDPNTDWYDQNLFPGLAAVNPKNGDLVAFYGGTVEYNNATTRQVQAGTTFDAFTLTTAYADGYSENSYMDGTDPWPNPNDAKDEAVFASRHYSITYNNGVSLPSVSFNKATADSINTAFVRTELQLGTNQVLATINKLGIVGGPNGNAQNLLADSSLTLGLAAVTPARMADAFSTFPDNGLEYPLVEVQEVIEPGGTVWKPNVQPTQVLSPTAAETVTKTLTHVTHDIGATACPTVANCATTQSHLLNIAGMTGTAPMDFSDIDDDAAHLAPDMPYLKPSKYNTSSLWFNGYTPDLEVSVDVSRWIADSTGKATQFPVDNINGQGDADNTQYPLAIWSQFVSSMQSDPAVGGDPSFTAPAPDPGARIMNGPEALSQPATRHQSPAKRTPQAPPTTRSMTTPPPTDPVTPCSTGLGGAGLATGSANGSALQQPCQGGSPGASTAPPTFPPPPNSPTPPPPPTTPPSDSSDQARSR